MPKKYKTYIKPVWVEKNRTLHTIHNGEEEYLWKGPDDILDPAKTMKYLAKKPSDDILKAEKLEVPIEDLIGWELLDTRVRSDLLKWKRLLKNKEKKYAK